MNARRREAGAVLVEAAIVIPILLFLCFGIFEVGIAWRSSNELTRSVGAAILDTGRQTDGRYSDLYAMERITASLGTTESLDWVIVYQTTSADSAPPVDCLTAAASVASNGFDGVSDVCNVYGGTFAETATTADFVGDACVSTDPDFNFCTTTRAGTMTSTDRIGIAVQVQHDWLTGFFPGGVTLNDQAVIPIITGINEARNATP